MVHLCRRDDLLNFAIARSGAACVILAALVSALLLTSACSSSSTSTPLPDPTSTPSPLRVLEESSARMLLITTASFTLEEDEGETSARFFGLELQSMEGQISLPESFVIRVGAISPLGFLKVDIVGVGDDVLMSDLIQRGKWNRLPADALPFDFVNLASTLSDIIPFIREVRLAGTERVDGVVSWRIRGIVASESLRRLVTGAAPGFEVGLELWIGQDDHLLRRIRIEGALYSGDTAGVVRVLDIGEFDQPVEIVLPATSGS